MMTNVGVIDRTARLIVGLGLLGWAFDFYGAIPGWAEWPVTIIGAYPALTGALRCDPFYAYKGISTCAEDG
jgi:hypothetical protein